MIKRSELQDAALTMIQGLRKGQVFHVGELYRFLEKEFPAECQARGDSQWEPRYKNDARWAVKKAAIAGIIVPAAQHGEWQRV